VLNEEVQILSDQHRKIQSEGFHIPSKDNDVADFPEGTNDVTIAEDDENAENYDDEPNISVFSAPEQPELYDGEQTSGMYFFVC